MSGSQRTRWLPLVVAAVFGGVLISGCATTPKTQSNAVVVGDFSTDAARAVYVQEAPPAQRQERQPPRPSAEAVWVPGHWHWGGSEYEWMSGHWDLQPYGKTFVPGHWEERQSGWVWMPAEWQN